MSVYKHIYQPYAGKVTPAWMRIAVLAKYGFAEAWSSKITVGLFIVCLVLPLLSLVAIYFANNPIARMLAGGQGPQALAVNAAFFFHVLQIQCMLALVLASWIAPRLITFDLADNAMPILLSHPISRFGYVLGKYIALFAALSAVTWLPCLLLFVYQGYASPVPWTSGHLQIAAGLFAGSLVWIGLLSILGLALSSWVKWRVVATGIIFAAVLVPAGIGAIVTQLLSTDRGFLLNLPVIMSILWQRMLGVQAGVEGPAVNLPTTAIAFMLVLVCCASVAVLHVRVRAREVIRG